MKRFLQWVDTLFNEHKFARRFTLFWAMALITYSVWEFFHQYGAANQSHATVIVAIIGLLTVAIGLYQWDRMQDK